ncbi:MAG: cytochrome c biogenesis protein CcsA, partial [Saprospiraceae bacterium]|nr:cytochrome c biogenesis protein CcsA [Saprospiraceae bacterium]
FGGYWAWDPVENMSLVPWLILLAGLHSNIIAIKTGQSLKATYIFYLLTFITVIYSTFLTRSGVLGDSSVHAFTEMGLEWQLIILLSTYVGIAIFSFIRSYNSIPKIEKEENTWSREFWMFIGSLVLLFSAVLITFTTSIPVYNKLGKLVGLDLNLSPPLDPIAHYNKFQLWIAVFISTLSSLAMYLRFRGMGTSAHLKTVVTRLTIILLIASAFTVLTLQALNATAWQYIVLLLSAWFGILANLDFLFFFGKKKFHSLPTALSHFGFSVMIVGILFSGLNKEFISTNNFAQKGLIEGFTDDNYKRNILLLKDLPMLMNKYEVTYKSDTVVNHTRSFNINYLQKDKNGKILEDFSLSPTVIYDKSFTKIAASNPSTYRMWDKDIFTHIASLPKEELDIEYAREQEDSLKYNTLQVALNQSVIDSNYTITLLDIVENPTHKSYNPSPEDLAIGVKLAIKAKDNDSTFYAYPMLALRGESLLFYPDQINQLLVKFKLPEQFFEKAFTDENSLKYTNFKLKKGDSFKFEGEEYHFQLLTQEVKHPHYIKKEGDIVVGALITNTEGDTIQPIYLIRNNEQFNLKFELRKKGLHFRFMHIDPKDETIDIAVAHKDNADIKFPIAIAENIRRSDYVVLEAIVFPGINLFWIGSTLMMVGLFLAWWKKKKKGEQV